MYADCLDWAMGKSKECDFAWLPMPEDIIETRMCGLIVIKARVGKNKTTDEIKVQFVFREGAYDQGQDRAQSAVHRHGGVRGGRACGRRIGLLFSSHLFTLKFCGEALIERWQALRNDFKFNFEDTFNTFGVQADDKINEIFAGFQGASKE